MAITGKFAGKLSLARVFLLLLVLDIVLQVSGVASGLATLLSLCLVGMGLVLGFRAARMLIQKAIWRLRNRLYVTYVFIGVVPLVLLVMLCVAGGWIVVGQVAVYLVSSELDRSASSLANPADLIVHSKPADIDNTVQQIAPSLNRRMSKFEVLVTGPAHYRFPEDSRLTEPADLGDFTGLVRSNGQIYLWHCQTTATGMHVVVASPLTRKLLEKIAPPLGTMTLVDTIGLSNQGRSKAKGRGTRQSTQSDPDVTFKSHPAGKLTTPYNLLDFPISWPNPLAVRPEESFGTTSLLVEARPSAVLGAVFGSKFETGQIVFVGFIIIASLLILTELVSLVIGISLTRTITGTVHDIYAGTLKVAGGDFGYRIPVSGKDQLAELGNSFNNMSAQIERLVVVAKEKERMESELEIAREVQNQLFPRSAPDMKTVRLSGVCRPARSVSGDYYDYLCLPDGSLAFALGDVAGKGISAALLMASIQSIMRTQLAAGLPMSAAAGSGVVKARHSTSGVVAQLNKQLYANTAPEKYATFFFGVLDEHTRMLTYTNAGHLPPLLLHKGEVTPLKVTGTVVGAFPMLTYGEETVRIAPGDLLVAYTDGITEPENAYGEEFGEQRLADTILKHQNCEPAEIAEKILEAVCLWSSAPELPDDMTILIAQGIE